jgi:Galactose oxidase, central domain
VIAPPTRTSSRLLPGLARKSRQAQLKANLLPEPDFWYISAMLDTKRDMFNLAKLARFMSALAIVMMLLLAASANGQSLKDKCEKALKRDSYMETQLKNGKILIAGGFDLVTAGGRVIGYNPNPVGRAEICDPSTGKLSPTGSMIVPRCCASATLLQNGKVLIAGGTSPLSVKSLNSAEVYDPATGTFTQVGAMTIGRGGHTATLLRNGGVLVAGGIVNRSGMTMGTAELFNPDTRSFERTGDMHSPRASHTATLTSDGKVLIAGGCSQGIPEATAVIVPRNDELYDPQTGTFSLVGSSDL